MNNWYRIAHPDSTDNFFDWKPVPLTWRGRWRMRFTRAGEVIAWQLLRIAPRYRAMVEYADPER